VNGSLILPLSKVLSIFDSATTHMVSRQEQLIQEEVERLMRQELNIPEEKDPWEDGWDDGWDEDDSDWDNGWDDFTDRPENN